MKTTAKEIEKVLRKWKDRKLGDIHLAQHLGDIRRRAHERGLTDDGFHQACEIVPRPWEMTGRQA